MLLLIKVIGGIVIGLLIVEILVRVGELFEKFWIDDTWGNFR